MIEITDKLIAYRPLLAERTKFGYIKGNLANGKYLVEIDGKFLELDKKEFTIVWNKKQEGFK